MTEVMATDIRHKNRDSIQFLRAALYDYQPRQVRRELTELFTPEAKIHLAFPFEDLLGGRGGRGPF